MNSKIQYILARNKEKLEEKIKTYEEKLNSNSNSKPNSGKFKKDSRADEIIEDIKIKMTTLPKMPKSAMKSPINV